MIFEDEEFEWSNVGKGLLKILIGLIILVVVGLILWFFATHLSVFWLILKIFLWIVVGVVALLLIFLLVVSILWGLNKLGAR